MSRKLKQPTIDLLKAIVKPEKLDEVISEIEETYLKFNTSFSYSITTYNCKFKNQEVDICLNSNDFKELLKPYVWYKPEDWDGNPNNYLLVEYYDANFISVSNMSNQILSDRAKHFMYIEKP